MFRVCRLILVAVAVALGLARPGAQGVTFLSTADPLYNSSPPSGSLAGSGWQYEATFGPFLGTAIGPHHFLSAKHVGIPSSFFIYRGLSYSIVRYYDDPASDLRIFEVAGTVPEYAPLFSLSDEAGRNLVVIGRGMQRGNPVYSGNTLTGWQWGNTDTLQRWGENQVSQASGCFLYATFDQNGKPNEAHLSSGDSGGAIFINDGQVWRLAGINYAIEGPFAYTPGASTFDATLFDTRGLFNSTTGRVASGNSPVPSGFYAVRISTELHWIRSVISPALNAISAQGAVNTGNDVTQVSFLVDGDSSQTKRVLVRGLGPSLQSNGSALAGRLLNPTIELRDANDVVIATIDDWASKKKKHGKKINSAAAVNEIRSTGLAPTNAKEAALIVALPPGRYTAVLRGVRNSTGIGVLDVHDLDGVMSATTLRGLTASASIASGSPTLTIGLTVDSSTGRLLVRAAGPDLANVGVTAALTDPTMEMRNVSGALLATNDNWRSAANSNEIQNTGLAPADDRDPAILTAPATSTYTILVTGANGTTGRSLFQADLLP